MIGLHHHTRAARMKLCALLTAEADIAARIGLFETECHRNGGTYVWRQPSPWSSHMDEVSLLGITGLGNSPEAAIADWIAAAARCERHNIEHPATAPEAA